MTREEKIALLDELLKIEERNDIGTLTSKERAEFQEWVRVDFEKIRSDIDDAISEKAFTVFDYDHGINRDAIELNDINKILDSHLGSVEHGENSN